MVVGESQELLTCIHRGRYGIFSEPLLHSAFVRLVPGQLKTSNHPSFYMFLDFSAFSRHPSSFFWDATCFRLNGSHFHIKGHIIFSFYSLPCFHKFGIVLRYLIILISIHFSAFASFLLLRLFSTSQTLTVWHKASAQSGVMPSSSSANFSSSHPGLKIFSCYIIFRTPTQSSWLLLLPASHPCDPCGSNPCGHSSFWHATHMIFMATLPSNMPPIWSSWPLFLQTSHPCNLCGISAVFCLP